MKKFVFAESGERDLPSLFWVSRDRIAGVLADDHIIWNARPTVDTSNGDIFWHHADPAVEIITCVTRAEVIKLTGTTCDTALQLLRVGYGLTASSVKSRVKAWQRRPKTRPSPS